MIRGILLFVYLFIMSIAVTSASDGNFVTWIFGMLAGLWLLHIILKTVEDLGFFAEFVRYTFDPKPKSPTPPPMPPPTTRTVRVKQMGLKPIPEHDTSFEFERED